MTGMFQSSSTASGSPRLQTSSAFSPSSASMIWKSTLSRIRRATLRMTLESSTTRHVFISVSVSLQISRRAFPDGQCSLSPVSGRLLARYDLQTALDVENDHQLSIQPMHARRHLRHPRIEIDRIDLAAFIRELHHLADRIDQKPVGLAPQ